MRLQNFSNRQLASEKDPGFDATDAAGQLAGFLAVQNTYLSTFQSLGALGLLLGTIGLAVVQLRSVLERRGELALMRATGFRRGRLVRMVVWENAVLLVGWIGGRLCRGGGRTHSAMGAAAGARAVGHVGALLGTIAVVGLVGRLAGDAVGAAGADSAGTAGRLAGMRSS